MSNIKSIAKYFIGKVYKPILERYLRKTRRYRYKGIKLVIPPEVFHPAFFFTTKMMLRYISTFPLKEQAFLELGAGNGLISIFAAKKNANVTATDINPVAIQYLASNSELNKVKLQIIHSDLFKNIPPQHFDYIIINPPFYKKDPVTNKDFAWYCGKNGEYFKGLFNSLKNYSDNESITLMILSDGCDLEMINRYSFENDLELVNVLTHKKLIENIFIFRIKPLKK